MAITWYELHDTDGFSIGFGGQSVVRRYHARGSQNRDQVLATAYANSPLFLGDLIRSDVRGTHEGAGVWTVEVTYSNPTQNNSAPVGASDPANSGGGGGLDLPGGRGGGGGGGGRDAPTRQDPVTPETPLEGGETFETTAQTTRITQAIKTRFVVTERQAQQNVDAFGNAIGVTEDRVEGCEVYAPTFTFTIPQKILNLTWGRMLTIHDLTGKINERPFFAFPQEDVLYLGCSGQRGGDGSWQLSHKFSASLSEQNVQITPQITVPSIGGWDHVWVRYKQALVDGILLPRPEAVYVQQVYKTGDFTLLNLGG